MDQNNFTHEPCWHLCKIYLKRPIIFVDFYKDTSGDDHDKDVATCVKEKVFKIVDGEEEKLFSVLFNLENLGDSTKHAAAPARAIYDSITAHKRIKKMAIVHQNDFLRMVLNYLNKARGAVFKVKRAEIKIFSNINEAVEWCKVL